YPSAFEAPFQVRQRLQARSLIFSDPPIRDLVDRNGVQVMELLPSAFLRNDELRVLENREGLHHRLARHVAASAELAQCAAVPRMQPVEELTPDGIGKRAEDGVHRLICNLWVTCVKHPNPGSGSIRACLPLATHVAM